MIGSSNMSISRFGLTVSLVVYLSFLFAEYLRPGFVSNAMNVHVLWIAIIGFGAYDLAVESRSTSEERKSRLAFFWPAIVGILLALIVWHLGAFFGDMRLFFALAVGILPCILLKGS